MRLLVVSALGLGLVSCPQAQETVERVCLREAQLHSAYLAFIAPRRPPEKVQRAVRFHTTVQNMCAAGATLAQVQAAQTQAEAARSE